MVAQKLFLFNNNNNKWMQQSDPLGIEQEIET